jgi:hypothetical protein
MAPTPKASIDTIYKFVGNTPFCPGWGDASRFQVVCDLLASKEFSLEKFFGRSQSPESLQMTLFHLERGTYVQNHVLMKHSETQLSLQKLLKLGLDPNGIGFGPWSYLESAIRYCNDRVVECLLEADVDPNTFVADSHVGDRMLHVAGLHSWKGRILEMLLRAGGDPTVVNSLGLTPIHYFNWISLSMAASSGNVVRVRRILKQGLPDVLLSQGVRPMVHPLDEAVQNGHVEVVSTFFQEGMNPNHCKGLDLFVLALMPGGTTWTLPSCVSIIRLLVSYGARPDTSSCHPLAQALGFRNWPGVNVLLRVLLRAGANPMQFLPQLSHYREHHEPLSRAITSLAWAAIWIRFAKHMLAGRATECKTLDCSGTITVPVDHPSLQDPGAMYVPGEVNEPVAVGAEAQELEGHVEGTTQNSEAAALQKDADELMRGVLESKIEIQKTGLPLSFDGVVVLRLTSRARSQEVRGAILNCPSVAPALDHIREAGCSPQPDWSGGHDGPVLLVPLTKEQVDEANVELTYHHIVTPMSLSNSIRHALKSIAKDKRGKRPQLYAPEVNSLCKQFHESSPEAATASSSSGVFFPRARASEEHDEIEDVDAIPEFEFGLRTNSSVGFPENPYQLSE